MAVIIVGAGICGLATAVALDRVGIDSIVLESGPGIAAEGAAITVWNNGLQALARLRLKDGYAGVGEPIDNIHVITARGKPIGAVPISRFANEFGPGATSVYRPELTALLAANLRPEQLRFNSRLVTVEEDAHGITAVLENGQRVRGELLIGADGLRATTKRLFAPADLVYCKHLAWRGTTRFAHPFFPPGQSFSFIDRGAYFVAHNLTGGRFYWICTRATEEPIRLERSRWKAEAVQAFSTWLEPVRALIDATPDDAILVNDIYSCKTADFAPRPKSVLLGDAAHGSAPQLGQGACLALEDAVMLAECLSRDGWPAASERFVRLRHSRVTKVVIKSQAMADLYHRTSTASVWLRNTLLRLASPSMRLNKAGWAATISLPALSVRSSASPAASSAAMAK